MPRIGVVVFIIERNVSLTALGVECVATDYFEVFLEVETDTSVDIDADSTFVARISISGGGVPAPKKFCLVTTDGTQTGLNFTGVAAVPWNTEDSDADGWHDNVTNNSRITPSGISDGYVDISAVCHVTSITSSVYVFLHLYKNGSLEFRTQSTEVGVSVMTIGMTALQVPYSSGDYYEIFLQVQTDTSVTLDVDSRFLVREVY
jgi:hypothetical protein